FQLGHTGMGGRPRGARNKLGEALLADLLADWQDHGAAAIAEMRVRDPSGYVRVVANLLPRHVEADVTVELEDITSFVAKFRTAVSLLGNNPDQASIATYRRPTKLINGR